MGVYRFLVSICLGTINALLSEEVKSQVLLGVFHIRVGLLALSPLLCEGKGRKRWRRECVHSSVPM